jgi:hypothetical protein
VVEILWHKISHELQIGIGLAGSNLFNDILPMLLEISRDGFNEMLGNLIL